MSLQVSKVGLGVKEWKIFQGKTEESHIYVLAWKKKEAISKLQTILAIWKILSCSDLIYLTDRFPLRRVKDEAANFCLFLTMAKPQMKERSAGHVCHIPSQRHPPGRNASLAPCRTRWLLCLEPFGYRGFLSAERPANFRFLSATTWNEKEKTPVKWNFQSLFLLN